MAAAQDVAAGLYLMMESTVHTLQCEYGAVYVKEKNALRLVTEVGPPHMLSSSTSSAAASASTIPEHLILTVVHERLCINGTISDAVSFKSYICMPLEHQAGAVMVANKLHAPQFSVGDEGNFRVLTSAIASLINRHGVNDGTVYDCKRLLSLGAYPSSHQHFTPVNVALPSALSASAGSDVLVFRTKDSQKGLRQHMQIHAAEWQQMGTVQQLGCVGEHLAKCNEVIRQHQQRIMKLQEAEGELSERVQDLKKELSDIKFKHSKTVQALDAERDLSLTLKQRIDKQNIDRVMGTSSDPPNTGTLRAGGSFRGAPKTPRKPSCPTLSSAPSAQTMASEQELQHDVEAFLARLRRSGQKGVTKGRPLAP